MNFAWDIKKSVSNEQKHGVTFEEAKTVFQDVFALQIYDPDHSENEDRFILLGMSSIAHVLVVCHCYRANDAEIRIISARKATKNEITQYRRRQYA